MPEVPLGEAKPYNTLVLASPHGQVVRYRKIHPFSFAKEHEHYGAGSDHITVDVEGLRCTLFVCYDLRFADEFWGRAEQTDAYVVVANWPERRRHHWTTLLQARAIENQAYVVGVNRVGHGNGLDYSGDSRIVDPWGEVLAAAAGGGDDGARRRRPGSSATRASASLSSKTGASPAQRRPPHLPRRTGGTSAAAPPRADPPQAAHEHVPSNILAERQQRGAVITSGVNVSAPKPHATVCRAHAASSSPTIASSAARPAAAQLSSAPSALPGYARACSSRAGRTTTASHVDGPPSRWSANARLADHSYPWAYS